MKIVSFVISDNYCDKINEVMNDVDEIINEKCANSEEKDFKKYVEISGNFAVIKANLKTAKIEEI